ncbi:MAG: hypothetical protein K0S70_4018, partial [Microbacterium sp.]|nr:hypothetical protein [Microbacterium sp.]
SLPQSAAPRLSERTGHRDVRGVE